MKEDKMENIHLIFKFLWYSVLFCIWGVSCTSSGTYKKRPKMDIYMQYYDFYNLISLSKKILVMYVPGLPGKCRLPQIVWRIAIILFFLAKSIYVLSPRWIRLNLAWIERKYFAMELNRHR